MTESVDEMRETDRELTERAAGARAHAYVPYSGFAVGAALLSEDGTIYTGCNIENASYPLTNCAERTAVFSAVNAGARRFEAIAIESSVFCSFRRESSLSTSSQRWKRINPYRERAASRP